MSDADDTSAEHYADGLGWDNIRKEWFMSCVCNFTTYGNTWEETGANMDRHLEDHEAP